jgi:hypothetical protein
MSKKTVSVCDRCEDSFANVSLSVRSASNNMSLKLIPETKPEEGRTVGPIDLCERCFKEIMKGVKWPKEEVKEAT